MDRDEALFHKCSYAYQEEQSKAGERQRLREEWWQQLEQEASKNPLVAVGAAQPAHPKMAGIQELVQGTLSCLALILTVHSYQHRGRRCGHGAA